jgi:DNA replicative helicase MCM subunit Mcm2 (Cdc46/Mcm family)
MAYIREIARSLYQIKNRLEELEQAWESEPPGEKRDELERELEKIRLEYKKVKNILEGAKHSPSP